MAYTPLYTWANGDVILAAEVQGELDNLREYVRQIPSNAIEASSWVEPRHIMRGDFDPLRNMAHYVGGHFGGLQQPHSEGIHSYSTVYTTLRVGATVWAYTPGTSITLEIRRPMTLHLNWWAQGSLRDNDSAGAAGEATFVLYAGSKDLRQGPQSILIEEDDTNAFKAESRALISGFHTEDISNVGTYHVGVTSQCTSSKAEIFAWGLSVEAFYL